MFERADAYLIESGQNERAELLRHCFYLKIGEHLTLSAPSTRQQLRRNLMRSYVDSWEWTPHKLQTLDQRHPWRIDQTIAQTNKGILTQHSFNPNVLSKKLSTRLRKIWLLGYW